jgi:hypothetical protein
VSLLDILADRGTVGRRGDSRMMIVFSLLIFGVSLALGTWNNAFPYYYHLDEPLEVRMILHGLTNFHHPLLMGNTTLLLCQMPGVEQNPQAVAEVGRWCMAVFGALASVAFAWVGFRFAGAAGGLAAGLLVALHPLLVELAHFYKEDPALLFGVAVSFLSITRYWDRSTLGNAALLGVANGLAFSGKYIGIVLLIPSFLVIAQARPRVQYGRKFAVLILGFLATVMAVNFQLVRGVRQLFTGVGREVALLDAGGGAGWITNKYVGVFFENSHFLVLIFAGWFAVRLLFNWRERTLPEFLILFFPLAFALMISLTPKTAERYFLPVSALVCLMAGIGLADFCRNFPLLTRRSRWQQNAVFAILLAVSCGIFGGVVADRLEGFGHDTRRRLADYITANLPLDAVIVQDRRAQLVEVSGKEKEARAFSVPQRVLSNQYAADFGSVSELRAKQIYYVVLMVGQKYKDHGGARVKNRGEYDRFVKEVMDVGELLWEERSRPPRVVNPHLALYRLPPLEEGGNRP